MRIGSLLLIGSDRSAVGTDPDANIRFELNRDAPTYSTGN
jgi:hypothetical protein